MISFTSAQLVTMLALQRRLNLRVNPDYHKQNFSWHRAAWIEAAELMDHIGWKWWKKVEPDLVQAQIEVVDIWHFSLSFVLQQIGDSEDVRVAADKVQTDMALARGPLDKGWSLAVNTAGEPAARLALVELFAAQCLGDEAVSPSITLQLAEKFGLTSESMYKMYVAKNVLNIFRQDHGYADGTYRKIWRGLEDNKVLEEWMKAMPNATPDELLAELGRSYGE